WPTSTSSARSTGSGSSRWVTTTSTGRPTSSTRAASWWATPAPTTRTKWWSGTWTWTSWPRSGTCGSSTPTAAPTSTRPWSSRERAASRGERENTVTILISGGAVVTAEGTLAADVLVAGERIAAVLARDLTGEPGAPPADAPAAEAADQVIDA